MVVSTNENKNRTIVQKINHSKSTDNTAIKQKDMDENDILTQPQTKHEPTVENLTVATVDTDTLKVDSWVESSNEKKDSTIVKDQYKQNNISTYKLRSCFEFSN